VNPEIKKLWTEALESGEYPQGKNRLLMNGKYCCLGVLCDLAIKAGVITTGIYDTGDTGDDIRWFGVSERYDKSVADLPKAVVQWAGLNDTYPEVPKDIAERFGDITGLGSPDGSGLFTFPRSDSISLGILNDSGDFSFANISKVIKESPL
jgi:hypothetical protein